MRNYVRKKNHEPMTDEQLSVVRSLISRGFSIRKAANEVGFNEKTLQNRLQTNTASGQLGRKKTFTKEQEDILVKHCIELDKLYFDLTLKSLRFLLFEYEKENSIPHTFCTEAKLAGRDFTRDLMKRNKLSLRVPRKTSVAQTMGFNRVQLATYFENLKDPITKFKFSPNHVYNMDESGLQTVPNKLPKHVAPTGKRDVSKTLAAEQGETVTAVCAMSATDHYVPPFFLYKRKKMNLLLIKGGPNGWDMGVTNKGYMTTQMFLTWLGHFKKHTNPSNDNPILLILDNHVSHRSLEAVSYAKSNNIHLLTLPPHSRHKTQPLDHNFLGPVKRYYDAAVDVWDVNHPGEVFNISCVAKAFKIAFQKAGTVENSVQGLRVTGIYPLDVNRFTEVDFLPSGVTDQDYFIEQKEYLQDDDNQNVIVFNHPDQNVEGSNVPIILNEAPPDPIPSTSSTQSFDHVGPSRDFVHTPQNDNDRPITGTINTIEHQAKSPEDIIPYPKVQIKRKRSGKGLKSVLLLSIPHKEKELEVKNRLAAVKEERMKTREAKKQRKQLCPPKRKSKTSKKNNIDLSSSSESDDVMSLHNSDKDCDLASLCAESDFDKEDEDQNYSDLLSPNDYALVKVHGKTKDSFRLYVAKILSCCFGGFACMFFKRYPNTYKFSETPEEAFVTTKDIILKLSKPIDIQNARFHKMISFPDDLTDFI